MIVHQLTWAELEAGLESVRQAPADRGALDMIVRRPRVGEREALGVGDLDLQDGLVGDTWNVRGSSRSEDGRAHPDMQLNVMSSRAIDLIAQHRTRWPLAGDQLFVDLDLSVANLPPGTHIAIGPALIVVTSQPHTGCAKFVERYGVDAMRFVNSPIGRELRLRGLNARVVRPGRIRVGDTATVIRPDISEGRDRDE
jgi:hypothetical protein